MGGHGGWVLWVVDVVGGGWVMGGGWVVGVVFCGGWWVGVMGVGVVSGVGGCGGSLGGGVV